MSVLDDVNVSPGTAGTPVPFRVFSDGTKEWPAGVMAYVVSGSPGAWVLQAVDPTHGLPNLITNASQKLTYGSSAAFTLTGTSLATDTNLLAGRQSTAIVNTTTRAVDYIISGKTKTGTSPTAGTIEVWAYGSFDDTPTYPDTITGTDGNITLTSTNIKSSGLRLVAILPTDTTTGRSSWMAPTSLLAVFGGILPKNFGLFVVHNTAVNLSSTAGDHVFSYTPVYYQGV